MALEKYNRGEALHTSKVAGREFVLKSQAANDVAYLIANIRHLEACLGERLDREDRVTVKQIEADYRNL